MNRVLRKVAVQTAICVGFALVCFVSPAAATAAGEGERLIVRFHPGTEQADRSEARQEAGVAGVRGMLLPRTQVVVTEPGVSLEDAVADLSADPAVAFAEPDRSFRLHLDPPVDPADGDPEFEWQWALRNTGQVFAIGWEEFNGIPGFDLDAVAGWQTWAQSEDVTTAVIDTGVADHPDLSGRIFENPNEIPGNGVDDDGNGLIDDIEGWDFVDGDPTPEDSSGHGTHVAGIIGATGGNGIGISGVSRKARILPIRACSLEDCAWSDVADSIVYAHRMGAGVINMSLGGPGLTSRATYEAIRAAADSVFVVSAGNESVDNDQIRQFPCMIDQAQLSDFPPSERTGLTVQPMENVICVANSGNRDLKAIDSNWGKTSVDLAAPGSFILSTVPESDDPSGYGFMSGTSMAAPQVSGIASLLRSRAPSFSVANIKSAIVAGAEPVSGWSSFPTVTRGRANLVRALELAQEVPPAVPVLTSPVDGATVNRSSVDFRWEATDPAENYRLMIDGIEVATGDGLASSQVTLTPGIHTWKVISRNQHGLVSESTSRTVKYAPDGVIKVAALNQNFRPRRMNPVVRLSESGRIQVRATATFRWSPRSRPKKQVIAKLTMNRRTAGRVSLKVPLTKAGLRMKRVAPRRKVTIHFNFRPELGGALSSVKRTFRFRKVKR